MLVRPSRAAVAALLALSSLGGLAMETPDPVDCPVDPNYPALTTAGFSGLIDAPDYLFTGSETNTLYFTVDLGPGAYADTRGTVAATLSWDVLVNDYDLDLEGSLSENYQPIDDPVEQVTGTFTHCQVITLSAIDFFAPANVEKLQLDLVVTRSK